MSRMPVLGCDEINNIINGTWVSEDGSEMTFNNGDFLSSINSVPICKGTYTTCDDKIYLSTTCLYGTYITEEPDSRWYTIKELAEIWGYDYDYENNILTYTFENDRYDSIIFKVIGSYSVNENNLILIIMNESSKYTKYNSF
jgi:hypothetical protein